MTISKEKATKIYNEVFEKAEEVTKIIVSKNISNTVALLDGWTYTFSFYKNELVKIEEYNHRELIECFVK